MAFLKELRCLYIKHLAKTMFAPKLIEHNIVLFLAVLRVALRGRVLVPQGAHNIEPSNGA